MFYTVYRTTNNVDGKVYIGKHQTNNLEDDYLGSGKLLRRAIKKHGAENFSREILFVFDNEDEMNAKEVELVTEEFCSLDTNYNLCPGGQGGFGYINSNEEIVARRDSKENKLKGYYSSELWKYGFKGKKHSNEAKERISKSLVGRDPTIGNTGMKHSDETKKKMSLSRSGSGNSQYGTMWINNGREARKIQRDQSIPEGWQKGRKLQVVC